MFLNHKNFLLTSACTILFVSQMSMQAHAQQGKLDGLPPQPAQSTIPEQQGGMDNPAPVPTAPLAVPLPDPAPVDAAQTSLVPPAPTPVPYSGAYYDSTSIGPSPLGTSVGPRNVDPKYEPGSSFVVVKKDASASSREANIVSAQRALKLGRYPAALEIYEQLYKKNPNNKQILMGLAVAQQYNGFNESAIGTYEEILKNDPKNTSATVNLMGLLEQRQPEVAYERLQRLWDSNSQNPSVAAQLGLVSAKLGDLEGAVRYLGVASSMEPENALHFYNLAIVYDQSKSPKSAIEYYQKALEVDAAHTGGNVIPRDQVYDRLAQLRQL